MALTLDSASGSAAMPSIMPTAAILTEALTPTPSVIFTTVPASQTTVVATNAAAPIGDTNNGAVPASATAMIIVGVVLGILGVGGVITLIWWMRRRHMARFRSDAYPARTLYPPVPPPKGGSNKALPNINVASANSYRPAPMPPRQARSNTVDSIDKDKALPMKPADSVWSPSDRPNKSPALASAQEMRPQHSPRRPHDEEMAMGRMRSDSIEKEPTAPANFI